MRLPAVHITPLRAVFAALVLAVVLFYAYGIFVYEDEAGGVGAVVPVRWLQVDPPALDVVEHERPYQEAVSGPDDIWRGYVVRGNGEPRLLIETRRQLSQITWIADGSRAVFGFLSRPVSGSSTSTGSFNRITGFTAIDVEAGRQAWERVIPPRASATVSPAGDRVLLTDVRAGQSGLYVLDANGTSRRLSGPGSFVGPAMWSPDGEWIAAAFSPDGSTESLNSGRLYYVFSATRDEGFQIGTFGLVVRWSPDGKRIAGIRDLELLIVEVESRQQVRAETTLVRQSSLTWADDGLSVTTNRGVIEAATGRVIVAPEARTPLTTISPNGAWIGASSDTSVCPGSPTNPTSSSTTFGSNRLDVRNVASGQTVVLANCTGSLYSLQEWLTPNALLIGGTSCLADCSQIATTVSIATLPAGTLLPLTEGPEPGAEFRVSPDRRRILVSGHKLRIYSFDGGLERTITPPEGYLVSKVAWTPDGAGFAYVVAPMLRAQTLP